MPLLSCLSCSAGIPALREETGAKFSMELCRVDLIPWVYQFQLYLPGLVSTVGSCVMVQMVDVLSYGHKVIYEAHRKVSKGKSLSVSIIHGRQ
jgi:hypothetical protein